jgi:hypothetical protein
MELVPTTTRFSTVRDISLNTAKRVCNRLPPEVARMWDLRLFKNAVGSKDVYDALADGKAVSKVETRIQ